MAYTDRSSLHIATDLGHVSVLKQLLDNGGDVNLRFDTFSSHTPLLAAVKANKPPAVRYLLERGANPDLCGDRTYDYTPGPLQTAASKHFLEVVRVLLEHGCNVNIHGIENGTPLLMECYDPGERGSGSRVEVANLLLDFGADIEFLSPKPKNKYSGRTQDEYAALHLASEVGGLEMVRLLLSRGADIEAVGGTYGTPLQAAAAKGHKEVVKYLLNSGADVNGIWGTCNVPLHAACNAEQDPFEIVGILLDRGAEVYLAGDNWRNALRAAAIKGYTKTLKLLLDHGPAPSERFPVEILVSSILAFVLPNLYWPEHQKVLDKVSQMGSGSRNGFSKSAVEIAACAAASTGHFHAVKMLLDTGSGKHLDPQALGRVLLSAAGTSQTTDITGIVRMLLNRGAVVDAIKDDQETTTLINAVARNQIDAVRILISSGADVNAQSPSRNTAILTAAIQGTAEVTQLLKTEGASVDGSGVPSIDTPLMEAGARGRSEVVKILLSAGANTSICTQVGRTPVHAATGLREHEVILQLLLKSGADLNAQDFEGNTALHIATRHGRLEVMKLLQENGARLDLVNQNNVSPLRIALILMSRVIGVESERWPRHST